MQRDLRTELPDICNPPRSDFANASENLSLLPSLFSAWSTDRASIGLIHRLHIVKSLHKRKHLHRKRAVVEVYIPTLRKDFRPSYVRIRHKVTSRSRSEETRLYFYRIISFVHLCQNNFRNFLDYSV